MNIRMDGKDWQTCFKIGRFVRIKNDGDFIDIPISSIQYSIVHNVDSLPAWFIDEHTSFSDAQNMLYAMAFYLESEQGLGVEIGTDVIRATGDFSMQITAKATNPFFA